jgi:hypothetical protein
MKFIKLTNLSSARRSLSGLRDVSGRALVFNPHETKPVHPSVAAHPAVKALIDKGILTTGTPVKSVIETPVVPKPEAAPVPEKEEEPEAEEVEEEEEDDNLQATYLNAPGITERNVEEVLAKFPTIEALAGASEDELVDAGVRKSFAGRVLEWATEEL